MTAGIDIGTSSVKLMLADEFGVRKKVRVPYEKGGMEGFLEAIKKAFSMIDAEYTSVSLSSQTGTYVIDGKDIIPWYGSEGTEETAIAGNYLSGEEFLTEIDMPHPDIVSYPFPRLLYISKHYRNVKRVCQLKDEIIFILTGEYVTERYTWRGLAGKNGYSKKLLQFAEANEEMLPKLRTPFDLAGIVTPEAEEKTGIKRGTKVYIGLNDYFAGLLGMGITESGVLFDITGTSEHIGAVVPEIHADEALAASPYFDTYVRYGVTASSGAAISFGRNNFKAEEISAEAAIKNNAPIFLPYLKGMRMPEKNSAARGMLFGISGETTTEDLAYSVIEGASFSAYSVYELLNEAKGSVLTAGGTANNSLYNTLKASLFGRDFITLEEKDTSALGACMVALVAQGAFSGIGEAAKKMCIQSGTVKTAYVPGLCERYELFKKLYKSNLENFNDFGRLKK